MNRLRTQNQRIIDFLATGHSLSATEALRKFGCFRLAARVRNLRDAGHKITSHTVAKDGRRWARCWL